MNQLHRSKWITAFLIILVAGILLAGCDPPPNPPTTPALTGTAVPTHTTTPPPTFTPSPNLPPSNIEALSELPVVDASAMSLGDVTYLGGSGQTYQIPSGYQFQVKRIRPFRFDRLSDGTTTYTAVGNERVWSVRSGYPLLKLYDEEHVFGAAYAGCTVTYVQIDDDPDQRRNRFYLNGSLIHTMPEGMVVNGRFSITRSGTLTLFAEDSIAANIEFTCPPPPTNTHTPRPTLTPTPSHTPSQPVTATPTTPGLVAPPTITATAVPNTPTITPTPSPTVPTGPAYTRFNFEMAGQSGRNGACFMHRETGELLLVWEMQDGWVDSATHPLADEEGWIPVDIPHVSVYVEVYCDAGEGIVRMNIVNGIRHPETGEIVGWLTRGIRNAMEIAWP